MKKYKPYLLLGALIAIYALLTFAIPPDPESLAKYNLTSVQSRLLSLTIVLPISLIWFAALYGYLRFAEYAKSISKSADGQAISRMVKGLKVLAYGLPVTSIVSTFNNVLTRRNPDYRDTAVIINHYASIAISLIAFWLLYKGARKLMEVSKGRPNGTHWGLMIASFVAMVFTYVYLVFSNPARNDGSLANGRSIFYLPDWLILFTIVLPYLAVWFMGLASSLYVNVYHQKVQGILYKQAFRYLAWGLFGVIGSSIFLQYLTATSNLLTNLTLAPLLMLIYFLLMLIAAGYVMIAFGARKLKQIEEV